MKGRPIALALLLVCLLAGACARLQNVVGLPSTPAPPNAKTAIALSSLADAVYLVDPSTGAVRTVASQLMDFQSGFAAWAPDHVRLAYGNAGIFMMNADSGHLHPLSQGQSLSMPAWSPDGRRIAYGDGLSLWVSPAGASSPVKLALPKTLAPLSMDWTPRPLIVFQGLHLDCNQPGSCLSTDESDIWTIAPDGTGLRQLTQVGHARNPKWSPDGSRILFVRTVIVKKTKIEEIWTVRPDGTGLRRLTRATGVLAADWSSDGQRVAIVSQGKIANTLELWIADATGANMHLVGNPLPGSDASIDW